MKSTLRCILIVVFVMALNASATLIIHLSETQSGNSWYQRETWTGGSYTDNGFSYGDPTTGLIHTQRYYVWWQGADRTWESKNIFFQIDISSLVGLQVDSATFNFYMVTYNTPVESHLRHLETQTTPATGDAEQRLAGDVPVIGTDTFTMGWNNVDLTAQVISDLNKGYSYTVLSIPEFSQAEGENRLLSMYGSSTHETENGISLRPYLSVIPEPSVLTLLATGATMLLFRRRR